MAIVQGTDNPDIINGTSKNDEINALGGDDTVFGSAGNDTIKGSEGTDTLDLKDLEVPITAIFSHEFVLDGRPYPVRTFIDADINSSLGQIKASDFELFIAPDGQNNTIDQSNSPTKIPVLIDLETGDFSERFSKYSGSAKFQNFVNAISSPFDDFITGSSANNNLTSGKGNDQIDGKEGDDTLLGTSAEAKGVVEKDTLTGGNGGDRFILGDASGAYYKTNGNDDLVTITDFGSGDLIQLGTGDTYRTTRTDAGFDLFVTTGGANDLIANVSRASTGVGNHANNVGIASTDDVLSGLPEGDFSIAAGENLGSIFLGA